MKPLASINLTELPKELLDQIPFSIRTKQSVYKISELPTEIQYLLERYYEQKVPEIKYSNVYDAKFEMSKYSDLGVYTSLKDLVLDYFRNYLSIRLGAFPYDTQFGCALKDQVQTKDTSLRSELIANEIVLVTKALSNDFGLQVYVNKWTLEPYQSYDHTDYYVRLVVTIVEPDSRSTDEIIV